MTNCDHEWHKGHLIMPTCPSCGAKWALPGLKADYEIHKKVQTRDDLGLAMDQAVESYDKARAADVVNSINPVRELAEKVDREILEGEPTFIPPPPRYSWSLDGETFQSEFESRAEAADDAVAMDHPEPGYSRSVWTGRIVAIDVPALVKGSAMFILDHVGEMAFAEAGEVAESWFEKITDDQKDDLDNILGEALVGWLKDHKAEPRFWAVEDIEETTVSGGPFVADEEALPVATTEAERRTHMSLYGEAVIEVPITIPAHVSVKLDISTPEDDPPD